VPAIALLAVALASVQAQQPALTVQQQFEAATAALDKGDASEALRLYEDLERRVGGSGAAASRSRALVRVRKGQALLNLQRWSEAEAALRAGVAGLPADDASLREDRGIALLDLGELAEHALDYGEALSDYRSAEAGLTGGYRVRALRGLIQTGMFYDAPAALADSDRALAFAGETPADKRREAVFRTMRGRVLLNLGRTGEARKEFAHAVSLLGGLTEKVDINDLAARSDAAIAARLAGDEEEARKYLAWTGAGHFDEPFPPAADMPPPLCDEELKPDDVAVVELSVAKDGTVGDALPVYSSRQGTSALAFARAASGWSWQPERLERIGALFRAVTRVEMRCSTAAHHAGVDQLLRPEVDAWLERMHVPALDADIAGQAQRLKPLRDELARREAASGPNAPALVPILVELAHNPLVGQEESRLLLDRALGIARAANAPAPVVAFLGIRRSLMIDWRELRGGVYERPLRALLADPKIVQDDHAVNAVRLALAGAMANSKNRRPEAMTLLEEVGKAPGLGAGDAMRAAAFARLSSLRLASGDAEGARAAFVASGVRADQCALLDATPRLKRMAGSSDDFPNAALRWGFEGWVKLEYDLTAAGVPTRVRPTVAYPPFIFGKAGSDIVERLRYDPSFRPDGSLGCGGMERSINFRIAR